MHRREKIFVRAGAARQQRHRRPAFEVLLCSAPKNISMNKYLLSRTEPAGACSDTAHITGLAAAALALPSSLIDVAFDTDLLSIVAQAMWRLSRARFSSSSTTPLDSEQAIPIVRQYGIRLSGARG
jgi:hypothetical protein